MSIDRPPIVAVSQNAPVPAPPGGTPPGDRLDDWVRDWSVLVAAQGSDHTAQTYLDALNRLAPWIPDPRTVTRQQAAWLYRWLADHYTVSTANVTLFAARSFWRYLQAQGVVAENPWQAVKPRRAKDTRAERILTEEEVARLIGAAPPGPGRLFITTLYYTGCRVSEVLGLRWRDFHWDHDGMAVTVYGKGSRTRTVHVRPELWAALQRLPGRHAPNDRLFPWTRVHGHRIVKMAGRRCGLPACSPHWLRHSLASHALDHGAPIHVVQATLGHARLSTTEGYLHVRPGTGAADVLPWLGM